MQEDREIHLTYQLYKITNLQVEELYVDRKNQLIEQFMNGGIGQGQFIALFQNINNEIQQERVTQRLEFNDNLDDNFLHGRAIEAIAVLHNAKEYAFVRLKDDIIRLSDDLTERVNEGRMIRQGQLEFPENAAAA